MKPIQQKLSGKLFVDGARSALWLALAEDGISAENYPIQPTELFARYALVQYGSEAPLFPAFLLDDWGNELKGAKLYSWLVRQGHLYPRSEIFGYDLYGRETQRFVKEIEIDDPCYCYINADRHASVAIGTLINTVVVANPASTTPVESQPPAIIGAPLRKVRATWYQIPPLNLLNKKLPI
jgi:hypothetical protein